jgi:hypothetical protein
MTDLEPKEISLVKTQATKAYNAAQELTITTPEEMVIATDHLSKMKTVAKMIKERKEAITKPLNEALSSARDLFKPIESNLADAEALVKRKMLDYNDKVEREQAEKQAKIAKSLEDGKISEKTAIKKMEAVPEVQNSVQGKVGAVSTKLIKKYRVVDESKLPREFLMPDMGKITEALKAGQTVAGAEMYEEKIISAR